MFQEDGKELRLHLKDPELPQADIEEVSRQRNHRAWVWRNTTQAAAGSERCCAVVFASGMNQNLRMDAQERHSAEPA